MWLRVTMAASCFLQVGKITIASKFSAAIDDASDLCFTCMAIDQCVLPKSVSITHYFIIDRTYEPSVNTRLALIEDKPEGLNFSSLQSLLVCLLTIMFGHLSTREVAAALMYSSKLDFFPCCLILHILSVTTRTPAPRSTCTTPTLSLIMVASTSLSSRRRPYKGKVNGNLLLEQLFAICTLNCSGCFFESRVFNEDVTLYSISIYCSPLSVRYLP